jgi:hypothetical protein
MGIDAGSDRLRADFSGTARPLRRIPAIVSFLNSQPPLSLVGGNRSLCHIAVVAGYLGVTRKQTFALATTFS